jgi:hypothetical protein
MPNYGDLFDYLELKLNSKKEIYIGNFYHTEKFCKEYNLDSERIILTLYDFGGHNDVQILYNVIGKIRRSIDLNEEVETPVEFAIRNNLYCRWHEGIWVRCKKGAKDSRIDLNKANEMMFGEDL